jgi:hypothetical protein
LARHEPYQFVSIDGVAQRELTARQSTARELTSRLAVLVEIFGNQVSKSESKMESQTVLGKEMQINSFFVLPVVQFEHLEVKEAEGHDEP